MDWTLEVVVLPVSDIDRSIAFYRDQVGFHLDHDTKNEHMHVVQLTPNGSGCSIVFGDLPAQTRDDARLDARACSWSWRTPRPRGRSCSTAVSRRARSWCSARDDGGTFFGFADPDGNTWAVQELSVRAEKPLIPLESARSLRRRRLKRSPVPTVYDLSPEQLTDTITSWGEPAFRAKQVWTPALEARRHLRRRCRRSRRPCATAWPTSSPSASRSSTNARPTAAPPARRC